MEELEQKALDYIKNKEYDKAAKIYLQLAVDTENNENYLISAANCYNNNNDKKLALGLFKKILENNPQSLNALINISTIYYQLKKYEKSEKYALQALEIKKDNFSAIFNLGNLNYSMGKYKTALEYYEKMYKINPNSYLAIINLANTHYCLLNFIKSLEFALTSIKKRPSNADAYIIAGNSYLELNKIEESAQYLKKAIELAPNSPWVLNSISALYQRQNNYSQSLHYAWKSFAIKGKNATTEEIITFGQNLYEAKLNNENELVKKYLDELNSIYNENPVVTFINAFLSNQQNYKTSDIQYVKTLFDGFASSFENVLNELEYIVPDIIAEKLKNHFKTKLFKKSRILDIGCGTGLCAKALTKYFPNEEYYGVDISERMLEQAEEKNIYTMLTADEIVNFLSTDENIYHAVVAGDVLTYFGDIKHLFKEVSRVTKFNGLFCFSITKNTENNLNYYLTPSGRFLHSINYIYSILKYYGFEVIEQQEAILRHEGNRDISGYIILAKKSIEIVFE